MSQRRSDKRRIRSRGRERAYEPLLVRVEDSGEPDADTIREAIDRVIDRYRAQGTEESQEAIREAHSEAEAAKSAAIKESQEAIREARSEAEAAKSAALEAEDKWRSVEVTATRRGQKVGSFLAWLLFWVPRGTDCRRGISLCP